MYEQGEWSDLDIVTATKTLRVHKSVVCPRRPFIDAICGAGVRKSRRNSIRLEETDTVVDAMLRHLYELPMSWREHHVLCSAEAAFEHVQDAVHLIVAADKYDVQGLGVVAYERFIACIFSTIVTPEHHVTLGELFLALVAYEPFKTDGRKAVAKSTNELMKKIMNDDALWDQLYSNEEYIKLVLGHQILFETPRNAKSPRFTLVDKVLEDD